MFLIIDGRVWDPDFDLAAELAAVIDRHLETLRVEWDGGPLRDELGYFDRMEHLTGLGFTACQAYITATYGFAGVPKLQALRAGPKVTPERTLAEVVNHAANYWKHNAEWHLDKSLVQRERIAAAFEDVGIHVDGEYPLSGILAELAVPASSMFSFIMVRLGDWREQVRAMRAA